MARKAADANVRPSFAFSVRNGLYVSFEARFAIVNSSDEISTYRVPEVDAAGLSVRVSGFVGSDFHNPDAWRVEIEPAAGGVDMAQAEAIFKKLREVHNALDKSAAGYGPAATFGAFVQRVAFNMGAKNIAVTYEGSETLTLLPLLEGAAYINHAIEEWETAQPLPEIVMQPAEPAEVKA